MKNYIKKSLAAGILCFINIYIQDLNACQKLESAIKNKSVPVLFVNAIINIKNNEFEQGVFDELKTLFACSKAFLEKNKNNVNNIDVDDYNKTMMNAVNFLNNNINLVKTAPRIFSPFLTSIERYNKQAYIDIILYDKNPTASAKTNFEKFFKDGNYEIFFNQYKRFFLKNYGAEIDTDENLVLNSSSYPVVANYALLHTVKSSERLRKLTDEERFSSALKMFNYINEFRVNVSNEIAILKKKVDSFFTLNKSALREKITYLNGLKISANQISEALLINDLYKKIPKDFYAKIAQASPYYAIIYGQTESLLIAYKKITQE